MKKYDLIIIGGGAAAFASANTANALKKKTLIINDSNMLPLGGTCVNVGCVPSKIMLHQGATFYHAIHSSFRGIRVKGNSNFVEALKETKEMVEFFRKKNYGNVLEHQEYVDFVEGRGFFIDAHTVGVGEDTFHGEKILIATGASTHIPSIKGIKDVDYLTHVSFFELKKKPESMIILGGGAIAMEFAQLCAHFGINVTVVQRSKRVLSRFDSFIGESLQNYLEEEGVTFYTESVTKEVLGDAGKVTAILEIDGGKKTISAEKIFIATGLRANTSNISIENTSVEHDEKGFVKVNEYLETSQKNIYAVGDVNGLFPLETIAAKQGNVAVKNMFEDAKQIIDYSLVPSAVFTSPEVASVGIGEEAYMKKYTTCLCRTIDMSNVEKAGAIKDTRGKIKMVLDHTTRQVVGVHIIAPMAADIITTATYAIVNKMTPEDIRNVVHVFPTMSEMIKKVAQSFTANLDATSCCIE